MLGHRVVLSQAGICDLWTVTTLYLLNTEMSCFASFPGERGDI